MKIIAACAKIIKIFSTKIIIIFAESLYSNTPGNRGNFNPSEKSKTFIFVKKCVSLCVSIYYDH